MGDNYPDGAIPVLGGVQPVSEFSKVEQELNESLSKIAAGDGPHYKLIKVHSASTQVVAGSLTKCCVDLQDEMGNIKKSNIAIWSRPWLPDGIEVTIECDGEDAVVRKHSA